MTSTSIAREDTNGTSNGTSVQQYDVIVIGAGFSGITNLYQLRKEGFNVHVFEGASDFGGVWYWNRYPGARVDSEAPFYQLNIPEVYNTWNFSERFPDHNELRQYFAHVDKTLDLRKDVSFGSLVSSAEWDEDGAEWHIKTENGKHARARWLVLGTGLLHKTHTPKFPGVEDYKGTLCHSGAWPKNSSVEGKRVAVIGSGATSIQIVQELGKTAAHLTMMMRRPSYCLPMVQRKLSEEEQQTFKAYYPALFAAGRASFAGFPGGRIDKRVQDVDPAERESRLEEIWKCGGFQFLMRNYNNVVLDKEANAIIYEFWKKKIRERLTDPEKQKLMAPDEMSYYFGTKRTPLEQDYYEVLNQDNVEIVDLNKHPLEKFTERGMKLGAEEADREFDLVVFATGFDSFTGSLTSMGLKGKGGVDIKDVWKEGVRTYLGITMHGFPNAFQVYSPQAPTPIANGTTIIEAQTAFIVDAMKALRDQKARSIEPTAQAEEEWKEGMNAMMKHTLYPLTASWWTTANIPGKKSEIQIYIGGLQNYEKTCLAAIDGWKGFEVAAEA